MATPLSHPTSGTTVLLFGPQAPSFNEKSADQLRSTLLETPGHRWILDTIAELPEYFEALSKEFPKIDTIPGAKLLLDLNDWLKTARFPQASFPLPNILLTPLVVIIELTQYVRYLELGGLESGERPGFSAYSKQNAETLGFCTGLLSALAVSSSASQAQLQQYGAVAVRLAMFVGALVDVQDKSTALHADWTSFSAMWNSPASKAEMTRILKCFPEAYDSVLYDEKRVTVTTPRSNASSLLQQLNTAGVSTVEVGLRGHFHCKCYHDDVESLIKFCDSQSAFQFPDASALVLPTRSNSGGDYINQGKLHHVALRAILLEPADWYQTFAAVQSSQLTDSKSRVVSFGLDRCVPPTHMRKLGARLVHFADVDTAVLPGLPTGGLDPEAAVPYQEPLSDHEIAVVGMACKVAGADDLEEFWDLLCEGKSQHVEVPGDRFGFETAWRDNDPKRKWFGNFVRDHDAFDHKFWKRSPRESASTDPQQRLMLQIALQAVQQSGYFYSPTHEKRVGCYIGLGTVDYEENIACYPATAFAATGNLRSFAAGRISHALGWTGPALTIDTACSSSAVAVHQACKAILNGECMAALAGGVALMTSPRLFQDLAAASFLSPTGPCKPFDAKADGYCRGDGIGAVFLKKMSSAIADGDQILGVISSTAVYQNQNCTPITVPNAESLSDLFRHVTYQARLKPEQITVVEAHGTGTPVGDPAEYEGIRRVFGGSTRSDILSVGSVKGLVGHTEGAAGIISLIKMLLMMHEGAIPPQASFNTMNPSIKASPSDKMEITTALKPWEADFRAALINNYGASGSNASMVVTQASPLPDSKAARDSSVHPAGMKHPFWFCGFDERSVRAYSARFLQFLRSNIFSAKNLSVANLAFNNSRQTNRWLPHALIFSCSSVDEVEANLTAFENGDKNSVSSIRRPSTRPVILCFGGQISTFIGLDQQVYKSVKILRSYLDHCDSVCRSIGLDGIYPEIFQTTPIGDIVKLQTMLFALQYSCAKSWIDCGIQVSAVVGHSFGELTALCISSVLSLKETIQMIAARARLVRDSWGAEKGSMMAVEADLKDLEKVLAESSKACQGQPAATIACFNGPRNFTLAGSTMSIEAVQETVAKNAALSSSLKMKKLNVTNAFHSILVEPLMADLEQAAEGLTFREPTIPLERATESQSTEGLTSRFVAAHMRYPVYFNHAVERLSKRYPSCVWLEAGSNSTITTMAKRALGLPSGSHFQPINITSDNALQHLTDATMNLWKEGLNVSFWLHHSSQTSEFAPLFLPPYQFERSKHWMDLKKPQKTFIEPTPHLQAQEEPPMGLWSFVGYQDSEQHSARFRINTMNKKFGDYVSGYLVAQAAPVYPITLQLSIVIEALMSLRPEFAASNIQPQLQGLSNHAPIYLDPSRLVWLDVKTKDARAHMWDWKMVSNAAHGDSVTTLHVSGKIEFRSVDDAQLHSDFARYERLVGHQRCLHLLDGNDADDVIQGRNIYKIFAEIVEYSEEYRGVQKIVGKNNESAGRIVKSYSGETWLDIPLADSFCQVAGIFVNCMTDRSDKDILIPSRIEQWIRSPELYTGITTLRPEVWDVFACHHRLSDKELVSDIFVFDSHSGILLEVILGICFQRISKAAVGSDLSILVPRVEKIEAAAPFAPAKLAAPNAVPSPLAKPTKAPTRSQLDISGSVQILLADISGLELDEIKIDTGLADIGIDSLMGMELAREIEGVFKCSLDVAQLNEVIDVQSLIKCIQSALGAIDNAEDVVPAEDDAEDPSVKIQDVKINGHVERTSPASGALVPPRTVEEGQQVNGFTPHINGVSPSVTKGNLHIPFATVLEAFEESKELTDHFISKYKLGGYVDDVIPKQTEMCVVHIVDAFEMLGCDFRKAKPGQILERIQYLAKHEKYVNHLYTILEEARLIDIDGSRVIRTAVPPPAKSAEILLQELIRNFPDHAYDNKLTYLVGSKLVECLTGTCDGIQLIFASPEGRDLVSGMYGQSPINVAWLKQMEDIIKRLISKLPFHGDPIKILEMGAGTGGTTAGMVALLTSLNVPVEYTVTDISSSLVAASRKRFKEYTFMKFRVHDIEKPAAEDLLHSQHIIIATNCVHATHSLTTSTKNIHSILRSDGFIMMLEMTSKIAWVDLSFGVLEGWWLFDDGRQHALADQLLWKKTMQSVGYGHIDWTEGTRPEANLQRIIIALASHD